MPGKDKLASVGQHGTPFYGSLLGGYATKHVEQGTHAIHSNKCLS